MKAKRITMTYPDGNTVNIPRGIKGIGDALRDYFPVSWRPVYYPQGETWGALVLDPPGGSYIRVEVAA